MKEKIDYSKLRLKGKGSQDHFSLSVQCAAGLLGVETEYETLFALSTNAFMPAIQPGESCRSWWTLYGRDLTIDNVAGYLGLKVRPIDTSDIRVTAADSEPEFDRKIIEQKKIYSPRIRAAQEEGCVVLTQGGWDGSGPHGFVPWGWWGVIVEAGDNGPVTGATINGYKDNPIGYFDRFVGLSKIGKRISQTQADLAMLKLAIKRIKGASPFDVPDRELVFGLKAMDHWISSMTDHKGYCADCFGRAPDRSWTDAKDTAGQTQHGAQIVSSYLTKRISTFPPAAQPHIKSVISSYDKIDALLKPALTGQGGESYKQFIGDLDKQKAHAEEVLKPIKEELEKAADAMERVLKAMAAMPGQVRPEGLVKAATVEPVIPEGVRDAGVPLSVVKMLTAAGEKTDFIDVVSASGWAFSFRYKYDNWHWAALSGDDFAFIPESLGYKRTVIQCKSKQERDPLWDFFKQNTDNGLLSICTHIDGGLVYGYRVNDGQREIWFDGRPGYGWIAIEAPHPMDDAETLTKKNTSISNRERYLQGLKNAIALASPHIKKDVPRGIAGLEAYATDVEDPSKDFAESDEWFRWATFERLSARRCASEWLRRAGKELGGDAEKLLEAAARDYAAAADIYLKLEKTPNLISREPEHIKIVGSLLRQGIAAEKSGLKKMQQSLETATEDDAKKVAP